MSHGKAKGVTWGASTGESQGDGWGGPAKGAGMGPEGLIHDPEEIKRRHLANLKTREQRTAALEERLLELALHAKREETSVAAATRLHAIYEGQPVSRTLTAKVDDIERLSDDELRGELARLGRTQAQAAKRGQAKGVPGKPARVVN
jgi:hypothetical protein